MLALNNNLTDDSVDGETMSIGSADNINNTTLAEVVCDDIDLSSTSRIPSPQWQCRTHPRQYLENHRVDRLRAESQHP